MFLCVLMLPEVNKYTIYLRILFLPDNSFITTVASVQYFLDFKSFLVSQRTFFPVLPVYFPNDPGPSQHAVSPFSLQPLSGVPHKMLFGAAFCTFVFDPSERPF